MQHRITSRRRGSRKGTVYYRSRQTAWHQLTKCFQATTTAEYMLKELIYRRISARRRYDRPRRYTTRQGLRGAMQSKISPLICGRLWYFQLSIFLNPMACPEHKSRLNMKLRNRSGLLDKALYTPHLQTLSSANRRGVKNQVITHSREGNTQPLNPRAQNTDLIMMERWTSSRNGTFDIRSN